MEHHAFVIEAEPEAGIARALAYAEHELDMKVKGNPDVVVLRHGLLAVEDARRAGELAEQVAFSGDRRVIIIAASRAYHEAQNALLKLFEEPVAGTHLFLVLPSLGGLLPTLRSRVQILSADDKKAKAGMSESVGEFLSAGKEKRSALIKRLTSGKDEEGRRENRDEAIALLNGVEATAYGKFRKERAGRTAALLSDIATLRGYLYDRSAPVKMILEHLSLVTPKEFDE